MLMPQAAGALPVPGAGAVSWASAGCPVLPARPAHMGRECFDTTAINHAN